MNLFREDYNWVSEKDEKRRVKLPNKSANCSIGGKGVYQPSEEELAEAVAILVECGVVREVGSKQCLRSNEKAIASAATGRLRTSGCGGY